jgi:hypothetical protein
MARSAGGGEGEELVAHGAYGYFLAELQAIRDHKWHMSESAGRDVGFEVALLDWTASHRKDWRASALVSGKRRRLGP